MALASSTGDFGQFSDTNENVKKATDASLSSTSSSNNQLNFYESMYHFRKMFPNVDSDVIECVLRSNSGAIDKTIDHLLTMNQNNEISETTTIDSKPLTNNSSSLLDLPPSYTEFMSSKILTERSNDLTTASVVDLNVDTSKSSKKFEVLVQDEIENKNNLKKTEITEIQPLNKNNRNTDEFIAKFNKIVIGELAKDFLRVKLTSDQVKKIKCSIKKAKRSEIAAILNNREPDKPDLSFEMRKRLNELNEQIADCDKNSNSIDSDEPWRQRYTEISKGYEIKRQQMLQDEYLAKLIQNEEFLNELKTDKDFIQTLNYESSIRIPSQKEFSQPQFDNYYNYDNKDKRLSSLQSGSQQHHSPMHLELTNAELKAKLLHMGKMSQMKLTKLAAKFSIKAKSTYNKALDQTTSTCTSLFSSFTPLDSNDANHKYNCSDSYYVAKSSLPAVEKIPRKSSLGEDKNEEETYDVERIKFEEMSSKSSLNTINNNTSRYKKIYKSFKSSIRRNSSASNSSSSMNIVSPNYLLNSEDVGDIENNSKVNRSSISNGLNVFQNGYGYDEMNERNENYFYDHSVYPYAKTVPTNATLSKTSKKILDSFKLQQKKSNY